MVGGSWEEVGWVREIEAVITGNGLCMDNYLFLYFVYHRHLQHVDPEPRCAMQGRLGAMFG